MILNYVTYDLIAFNCFAIDKPMTTTAVIIHIGFLNADFPYRNIVNIFYIYI